MRRRADNVIARGWLESVSDAAGAHSVAIQVRERDHTHTVWVKPETIAAEPIALQSIVVVRSASPINNAQRPASAIEVVRAAAGARPGQASWALKIRSAPARRRALADHALDHAIRAFLDARGCTAVRAPLLAESVAASGPEQGAMPDRSASGVARQYTGVMVVDAMVDALERVYAFSPVLRSESAAGAVREVQAWTLQVEVAWASPEEVMHWQEGLLRHVAGHMIDHHGELLAQAGREPRLLESWRQPFPVLGYDEALRVLVKHGARPAYGCAFTARELALLDHCFETPYFITQLPWALAPFAAVADEAQAEVTRSHWLMPRAGQWALAVGGERASRWELGAPGARRRGTDAQWRQVPWYAETRRQGCVPHSGFELDFGRLCALVLGTEEGTVERPDSW